MTIVRLLATTALLAGMSTLAASAAADVPNPPPECSGKQEGDACSFQNGDSGACENVEGQLTCVVGAESDDDDDGCAMSPGSSSSGSGWLLLAAAALMAARRRR